MGVVNNGFQIKAVLNSAPIWLAIGFQPPLTTTNPIAEFQAALKPAGLCLSLSRLGVENQKAEPISGSARDNSPLNF
jgi:hypothetical protein